MTTDPAVLGGADERAVVEDLARRALAQAAPDELPLFDETAQQYFADPASVLDPKPRDESVGFGIELALLTPFLIEMATAAVRALGAMFGDAVKAEGTPVVRSLHPQAVPAARSGRFAGTARAVEPGPVQTNPRGRRRPGRRTGTLRRSKPVCWRMRSPVAWSSPPDGGAVAAAQVSPQVWARPDILALPSATASRSWGLLAAVAAAGMFAGSALHHALPVGRAWAEPGVRLPGDGGGVRRCLG